MEKQADHHLDLPDLSRYPSFIMFRLHKRQPKQMTDDQRLADYQRLLRKLGAQFTVGDSKHERVVEAMSMVDHEMNGNGGCNWREKDYMEYLDTLREHLTKENQFSSEQVDKIRWSLDEILACARELDQKGESSRNATEAVNYLILRVVDWCMLNPRLNQDL